MYDTSPERCVPGAVPGVGFMLINALLCLQYQFEDCTFCISKFSKIAIVCAPFDKKLASLTNYWEKHTVGFCFDETY